MSLWERKTALLLLLSFVDSLAIWSSFKPWPIYAFDHGSLSVCQMTPGQHTLYCYFYRIAFLQKEFEFQVQMDKRMILSLNKQDECGLSGSAIVLAFALVTIINFHYK